MNILSVSSYIETAIPSQIHFKRKRQSMSSTTKTSNNSNNNSSSTQQTCAVCFQEAQQRCSRCKQTWYCSIEHQKQDWKIHKKQICDDIYQADQYTLHKQEFDRIVQKYQLNTEEKSSAIAELLTSNHHSNDTNNNNKNNTTKSSAVTATQFAELFGTTPEEAVVFLEWIQVGVKFKQQAIDVAHQSGFTTQK